MLSPREIILRLLIAAVLGSLIGVERERRAWTAGLRTHMVVCVASCLLMIVSAFGFADVLVDQHVVLDPSRIAAQVVSGIGFLGAGIIIFRREAVHGLTTAASVWSVAAIGLATGGGMYAAAVSATTIILVILAGLKPIETRLLQRKRPLRLELTVSQGSLGIGAIMQILARARLSLQHVEIEQGEDRSEEHFTLIVLPANPAQLHEAAEELRGVEGVRAIRLPQN